MKTIKSEIITSYYGYSMPAILVNGLEAYSKMAAVWDLAAKVAKAFETGAIKNEFAICPDLERGAVCLEPTSKASQNDLNEALEALKLIADGKIPYKA